MESNNHEEKIVRLLEENHRMLKSIQRVSRLNSFFNMLKLLLIAVPIILALIYFPQYLRSFSDFLQVFQTPADSPLDLSTIERLLKENRAL